MCLYSYHAYFVFSLKSEKYVTERNKTGSLKPIYWLKKPVLDSCWSHHWKWLVLDYMCVVLEFLSNGEGLLTYLLTKETSSWFLLIASLNMTCARLSVHGSWIFIKQRWFESFFVACHTQAQQNDYDLSKVKKSPNRVNFGLP